MEPSLLYQDNMSAILLETNRKGSSYKRTKHIKVKYFYIKDKIDQGEIMVKHCPTEQMWSDINTKPKQGVAFCEFRVQVMGIEPDYCDVVYAKLIHVWTPENPVASQGMSPGRPMLPVPRTDGMTLQECVGGQTGHGNMVGIERARDHDLAYESDATDKNNVAHSERKKAPLRCVQGHHWSPGVYRSLRLRGKPVRVVWERAFVSLSTFQR